MKTIFNKNGLRIDIVELNDLKNDWEKINHPSLYLSFKSVESYVKNVVGKNKDMIFTFNENESVKGIFPLRFSNFNSAYFICYNFGFNLCPLWSGTTENKELFLKEIFNYLSGNKFITLLEPITKKFSEEIKNSIVGSKLRFKQSKSKEHLYKLTLKNTWDEYLSLLSKKFKKNLRYYQNKISNIFKVEFENSNNETVLKTFFELHSLHMRDKGDLSILQFKKFQDYYKDLILSFGENAGVFNLKLDGKVVASLIYIDFNGTRYFLNIGIHPEYKKYSVGRILIANVIEDSIKKGLKYFDFGKGDEKYKLDWGCEILENERVIIYSNQFLYFIFILQNLLFRIIKKMVITILKINFVQKLIFRM